MELDLYNEFFALEGRHWWFLGRRKLFMTLIRKYFGKRDDARILEECGIALCGGAGMGELSIRAA